MPTLSTNRPSAESKGRIRTTDREPETIMTTICSPAVRTHAVLATTTTPTTTSGISGLEKITVPASSALPETMVAPTAWSGVEMSPSESMLIAEISTTLPGDGTGEGVPSYPATVDPTASTTFFPWTNVPPAGSISSSATSLSSVSREDPKPILSLDTSASEITSMATAREGLALTESTATMEISRGAEAEILSTSGLPNISASPLIPKDKISTWATMTTIADTESENDVGPFTHIPDHAAPGDMTSVNSESTVGAMVFSTETSGSLKKVSGSDQGREPTDSTSIPMTGFTGRDSITDTETDIRVMETTPRATVTQAPLLTAPTEQVTSSLGCTRELCPLPLHP
ncbi:mucin-2-like isoform X2 [Monodelphis domestica]|uniref:mucin-2-like isoform X2 n=1 Tax=Monodelphis domestica TaxID=13616 RepID=UPI0024E19B03|nr:mucin-2-like isoform X2 [Monodelphis domestica]